METSSDTPDIAAVDNAPAANNRGWLYVLQTGLLTTALSLGAVYLLTTGRVFGTEFHVMGFHLYYVIPAGALAVGFVAGIGYGWAAWYTGLRPGRKMLALILIMQIAAYFVAQYIEFRQYVATLEELFRDVLEQGAEIDVSFWEYFHNTTMGWAWEQDDGSMGEPLGAAGYVFRGLEILGFALGALILPGFQSSHPYCDPCRRYTTLRELGLIGASVLPRKISKDDTYAQEAYEAEQEQARNEARQTFDRLNALAAAGDAAAFRTELEVLKASQRKISKLPIRIRLEMNYCDGCHSGTLTGSVLIGQGDEVQVERLASMPLTAEFLGPFLTK